MKDQPKTEFIDRELMDAVAQKAAASPRRRMNYNFHRSTDEKVNRLLNVMHRGSYLPVHRHLNPALSEAWFNLGNLALEHRDYARAHEAFEHVRRLNPDQPDLPLRLAWTFEGLRDESGKPRLRDAVAHYEAQLMASEKDVEALLGLARLFEGPLKEADRALALYERAIEALKPGRRQKEVIEARDRLKQRVALEAEVRAQADPG